MPLLPDSYRHDRNLRSGTHRRASQSTLTMWAAIQQHMQGHSRAISHHAEMEQTSELGDDNPAVGAVVVDVGGRHPHTGDSRTVTLLNVVRLQQPQ